MFKSNKKTKKVSAVRKRVSPKRTLPKVFINRVILLTLLIGSGYGAVNWYSSVQLFPVKQVRIEGEFNYLDKGMIKKQISEQSTGGFFDLDINSIHERLLTMQWVENAFVRRDWPETVVIRVVEKKPVAKWNDKGVLTAEGELFFPAKLPPNLELIKLKGPEQRHAYVLTELNKMQSMMHLENITISELSQNDRRSWKMAVNGITILLGRKEIYKKIENLVSVYTNLIKPKADKIDQIDFRYTNGFAVNWKKKVAKMNNFENTHTTSINQLKAGTGYLIGAMKNV